jgi:hypothetical protein
VLDGSRGELVELRRRGEERARERSLDKGFDGSSLLGASWLGRRSASRDPGPTLPDLRGRDATRRADRNGAGPALCQARHRSRLRGRRRPAWTRVGHFQNDRRANRRAPPRRAQCGPLRCCPSAQRYWASAANARGRRDAPTEAFVRCKPGLGGASVKSCIRGARIGKLPSSEPAPVLPHRSTV